MTRTTTDVAIVGAGIWGLAAHHFLRRLAPHLKVQLYEAAAVAGGAISTIRRGDFLFEPGPNSLLDNSPELRRLLDETGLAAQIVEARAEAARSRFIVRGGRLRKLPTSPPAMIRSDLFSLSAKLHLARELFVRRAPADAEETLEQFVLRRLGREFLDYAVDPFVSGTFAGVPAELCVRSAFRRLWNLEQNHGSLIRGAIKMARERKKTAAAAGADEKAAGAVQAGPSGKMLTFADGLQTLTRTLSAPAADRLTTGAQLQSVSRNDSGFVLGFDGASGALEVGAASVLLTMPSHAYANVRFNFDIPGAALRDIPYPPVTAVFFGYRQYPLGAPPEGFGFLVPRVEQRRILGTLWNSSAYPGRAPAGGAAFTTYIGGRRQPEITTWDDERLIAAVQDELRELMGIETAPDEIILRRWERAIPQYVMGHPQVMSAIDAVEQAQPGLLVGGNFRGGISVGDCVSRAFEAAQKIAAHLPVAAG
ncbi:MAG: protoporphyrinogen oxidase [bacterium]|nr:protoporphyrinogen oxidase [bacterium]